MSQSAGHHVSNFFVGDPEWIGGLERPEYDHSADNKFINRYAYIAIPAGSTLDLNSIHNHGKPNVMRPTATGVWPDGFLRNQGVLTSEINLAAFLVDLNTNLWPGPEQPVNRSPYNYYPSYPFSSAVSFNTGVAAEDAVSLLRYRYGGTNQLNSLATVSRLFTNGVNAFRYNSSDAYSEGPLMTGTTWPPLGIPNNPNPTRVNLPWSGADNPNHFYTTQDLFDQTKTALNAAARNPNVHRPPPGRRHQHQFLRPLHLLPAALAARHRFRPRAARQDESQLLQRGYQRQCRARAWPRTSSPGFPSSSSPTPPSACWPTPATRPGRPSPAPQPPGDQPVGGSVTNLQIQLWPTNFYTPSVHRLLQLAANIYDATTNNPATRYPYLPHVFQPVFLTPNNGNQVFITAIGR